MPSHSSRRSKGTTVEGKPETTGVKTPIPEIVPVLESSPSPLIMANQTSQQQTTMEIDEESVAQSIQSTDPLKMVIPKPLPTLASFWAWMETEFQPFYSDELNEIMMTQLGIISFQKMVEFFAEEPHKRIIQVIGPESFTYHRHSLVDLAIIWEFAQTLMSSGDDMILPTYGDLFPLDINTPCSFNRAFPCKMIPLLLTPVYPQQ